jgi:UDP-glucuronate decarboxylase
MDQNDGRVVSNFIVQALRNDDITIYGDGKQSRSFCYVDDLIEGIVRVMEVKNVDSPINLGNNSEFDMNSLAKTIIELTNSNSKIVYQSLPEDDPKVRQPDTKLAKSLINWEASTTLIAGLEKTIEYFKMELGSC